jgi:hypothetical protein
MAATHYGLLTPYRVSQGREMKLAAIGLFLLAILACPATTGATSHNVLMAQDEPRYPLGGAFFTGGPDALVKLKDFAGQKRYALEIVTLPRWEPTGTNNFSPAVP